MQNWGDRESYIQENNIFICLFIQMFRSSYLHIYICIHVYICIQIVILIINLNIDFNVNRSMNTNLHLHIHVNMNFVLKSGTAADVCVSIVFLFLLTCVSREKAKVDHLFWDEEKTLFHVLRGSSFGWPRVFGSDAMLVVFFFPFAGPVGRRACPADICTSVLFQVL